MDVIKRLRLNEEDSTLCVMPSDADAEMMGANNVQEVYSIKSKLGEGSFGKVYKVKNKSTGETLALKRIIGDATTNLTEV